METTPTNLQVGDAVFYARENTVGLIYETYTFVSGADKRPGVSLLLRDGRDIGGFSAELADAMLQPLGNTGFHYEYTNVSQLHIDYRRGRFENAFHVATVLAGQHT